MAQIVYPKFQALDNNGNLLDSGKLYTYAAGTDTAKTTYSDPDLALAHANTNPVIFNARGEADVYGSGRYKLVLKDSADAQIWSVDNIALAGEDLNVISPDDFAYQGDTDDSASIQRADDYAHENGRIVQFGGRDYTISTGIVKSAWTMWQGLGARNWWQSEAGACTRLINETTNGSTMITINPGVTPYYYSMYAGQIKNLGLYNDYTRSTSNVAISVTNTRQLIFENLNIRDFAIGISLNASGEIYMDRVFGSCAYALMSTLGADCWFNECAFGGITGATNVGYTGRGDQSYFFNNCRFQVCAGGHGATVIASNRIRFSNPIFDGNELGGLYLVNSYNIDVNNPLVFGNGTSGGSTSGISVYSEKIPIASVDTGTNEIIFATDRNLSFMSVVRLTTTDTLPTGLNTNDEYYLYRTYGYSKFKLGTTITYSGPGTYAIDTIDLTDIGIGTHSVLPVCRNINITGGMIYDENYPASGAGCYQPTGILADQNDGIIQDLTLTGVDLSRCNTPLSTPNDIVNLSYSNCPGLEPMEFANNAAAIAGGLAIGAIYRISSSDQMGVVHS